MTNLLELQAVTLKFGGLVAVHDVSFAIERGVIVGLIGPNGAGKSTIFNLITGLYQPTTGDIRFAGKSLLKKRVDTIMRAGVVRTFQNIRLFAFMSVRDNVMVGRHVRMKTGLFDAFLHTPRQRKEDRHVAEHAMELLRFVGLEAAAQREAHSLSYGQQRRLEIARALASDPQLLLLDEPAAGLNPQEKQELCGLIERIRDRDITVLLIEHDMPLVMQICRHLWVLDHGECIASGPPEEIRRNSKVIEAYLGQPAAGPLESPQRANPAVTEGGLS